MKKQIKPIILSAVGALAFASIAVGTTFALFTSKDETTIQVNSGKVDVSSVASIVNVYELNNDQPLVPSEQGVYTNSIGGTTSIEDNVVTLNNWAPGDKVVIDLQNLNKSTVKVLTRLAIYHNLVPGKGDLYPALDITIKRAGETDPIDPAELLKWTNRDIPENPDSGESFDHLEITIEFPDHDNGEIIFDSSNSDNQYQDCACVISLGLEAVQGNAYISPAATFNEYARYVGDVITMSDAVEAADKLEYTLADFEGYVWDSKNYQFVSESSIEENFNQYFKAYDAMPSDPTFSIYANAASWDASVNLDGVGFDAGSANGITSINYVNTSGVAKTNTIRTNSGTLTINAGSDIVHHYGYADSLDIIAVAGTSYHEFGEVGYANIANGRLVVEEGSDIGGIFLVANNQGEFDNIKLGVVGEATLPALARADVSLGSGESKLVVEVQTLETSESVDPNPEYVWISNNGSEVDSVVSSSSSEIVEVLEPTAAAEAAKEESKDSSTPIDDNSVARINAVGYDTLKLAFDAAVGGDTVYVIKDVVVDVSNPDDFGLYRAGTSYYGIFYYLEKAINIDGGNHTIRTTGATLLPNSRVNTGFIYYDHRCDSVSITNLNIVSEGFSYVVTYGGVLHGTMENVNITADNACATISVFNPADTEFGVLNIRNCEFNFIKGSLTRSDYAPASSAIAGQYGCTINVEDCDISAVNGGAVFMWPSGGTVNFNSCNIETSDFVGNAWIGNGSTNTKADSVVNFNNSNIICPSDNKYSATVNGTNKYGHEAYVYVDGTLVATTASE